MPRVCHFTGKSTRSGNRYRIRGRAKYLGGVGTKITSCTKRTFKPNLQNVTAVVDGAPKAVLEDLKRQRESARDAQLMMLDIRDADLQREINEQIEATRC